MNQKFINPDIIDWSADEHKSVTVADLNWTFEPNFPIKNIGGTRFINEMRDYIDLEIARDLSELSLNSTVSCEHLRSINETRLADWIELERLAERGEFDPEPVQIANIDAVDHCSYRRLSICDGWHRIGIAIKYGFSTIPAYIGNK